MSQRPAPGLLLFEFVHVFLLLSLTALCSRACGAGNPFVRLDGSRRLDPALDLGGDRALGEGTVRCAHGDRGGDLWETS